MLIASDCCFVLVDLTWSTFCVHIFRRQLQTNMAVRLCDVASLLRSGSWAPEPWTGVCGTSHFEITWARRPAFCPCSGHTNDVSSQSYFDNQIKMFHLEFGPFLRFCLRVELTNVWLYWYGLNLSAFVWHVFLIENFIKFVFIWPLCTNWSKCDWRIWTVVWFYWSAHGECVKGWLFIHEFIAGCLNWLPHHLRPVVWR